MRSPAVGGVVVEGGGKGLGKMGTLINKWEKTATLLLT